MLPLTELSGREWRKLSQSEFVFDRANSTVTVTLPSNQGLLIYRGGNYRPEPPTAEQFVIDEIRISGSNGEINLTGDALPKAFVVVPQPLFTFGPPTLLMLTYS